MNQIDQIQMMKRCSDEITGLRRQIDALRPRAEAFDAVQQILGLLPRGSQGMGEDVVWMLKKAIADEERKLAPAEACARPFDPKGGKAK